MVWTPLTGAQTWTSFWTSSTAQTLLMRARHWPRRPYKQSWACRSAPTCMSCINTRSRHKFLPRLLCMGTQMLRASTGRRQHFSMAPCWATLQPVPYQIIHTGMLQSLYNENFFKLVESSTTLNLKFVLDALLGL